MWRRAQRKVCLLIFCLLAGSASAADLNFYLRCASTSLDLSSSSRLKVSASNPRVLTLSFQTKALAEDCTLTETDGLDREGELIFDYNLNYRSLLANGEQTWIGNPVPRPGFFRIDYVEEGWVVAKLDLDSRYLWLTPTTEPGPEPEPEPGSYFYFLCNTTSWLVGEKSRFKAEGNDLLSVRVAIPRDGFAEMCTVTETPEKNDWGEWQLDYDLTGREVFEGYSFGLGKAQRRPYHFRIEYKKGGQRMIYLSLKNRRLWIGF